jgi:protein phosphatase PTC7
MTSPQVSSGDVIILGSDGLWDNISVPEVSKTVTGEILKGSRPSIIAQRLAGRAFEAAMDRKGSTPYSVSASEAFDMIYSGGKPDDITVLVTHLQ